MKLDTVSVKCLVKDSATSFWYKLNRPLRDVDFTSLIQRKSKMTSVLSIVFHEHVSKLLSSIYSQSIIVNILSVVSSIVWFLFLYTVWKCCLDWIWLNVFNTFAFQITGLDLSCQQEGPDICCCSLNYVGLINCNTSLNLFMLRYYTGR